MRRASLVLALALVLAGARGTSPVSAAAFHPHSAHGTQLYTSVTATKHCLAAHKVFADPGAPYWPAGQTPAPTAHFIFGDHSGDNGYIMFYRSTALAHVAAERWITEQQRRICLPLGHTMSWCNEHLPVPGIRQTTENVLIDWISGPKTYVSRQTVTGCLR